MGCRSAVRSRGICASGRIEDLRASSKPYACPSGIH
jgi:hypothetical protein